jgi:hypothetical protein
MPDNIIKNEYGEVVHFSSSTLPERTADMRAESAIGVQGRTAQQVANQFIRDHLSSFSLSRTQLENDLLGAAESTSASGPVLSFKAEKEIAGAKVVVYQQKSLGIDVFNAKLGVQIDGASMNVASMQSSAHAEINVLNEDEIRDEGEDKKYTKSQLKKILGFELPNMGSVTSPRQVIYRYEPDAREEENDHHEGGCFHPGGVDVPPLPAPTIDGLKKGQHYVCDEVLFEASRTSDEPPVNWRALVEPKSGDVLYIRALVACATGMVFAKDPQTQGSATATGASTNSVLNPLRSSVTLPGLVPQTPQALSGEFVELAETSNPAIPAPTGPNPASAFNYDVRTDDFSAVNAYFHCDSLFRTMQNYGFDVAAYFDGTIFPVPVDHRALGNAVNAQAPGSATGDGLRELRFALLQAGQPVGIATSNRVVWHEFGHGLLWDHVNSPNFGFAHSAGDSLAAILNDPGTLESDRFDTFPWVQEATNIGRRHDRDVVAGWAWFGPQYNTQYRGEQILCTTMFRFYRSIGGDATNWLPTQIRASEAAAYLIFKAIGLLTSTTQFPEVFVQALQTADLTTPNFKGVPGGALHKVLRWSFEKQGLFQPGAAPGQGNNVTTEGNPPDVDVYIDDGRNGEYQFLANHWSCQDMWVRRNPDGGTTHQQPIVNQTSFMYVRVKNRGLQTANNVRVDAYHCLPGTGLAFPDDWQSMATATLPASGPIPSGGQTIVGPFKFVPTQVGHECLLAIASADGDPGNDTTIAGTIPENRFVPFDNNIGQRNVNPVYPSLKRLVRQFREHILIVRNPFRDVRVATIDIQLPRFLKKLGWEIAVRSEGGSKFELGPREKRKVLLDIEPGEELKPDIVKSAIAEGDSEIVMRTFLDGELSGGMSYPLSFDAGAKEQGRRIEEGDKPDDEPMIVARPTIEEILRILRNRQTRRIVIELDDDIA